MVFRHHAFRLSKQSTHLFPVALETDRKFRIRPQHMLKRLVPYLGQTSRRYIQRIEQTGITVFIAPIQRSCNTRSPKAPNHIKHRRKSLLFVRNLFIRRFEYQIFSSPQNFGVSFRQTAQPTIQVQIATVRICPDFLLDRIVFYGTIFGQQIVIIHPVMNFSYIVPSDYGKTRMK